MLLLCQVTRQETSFSISFPLQGDHLHYTNSGLFTAWGSAHYTLTTSTPEAGVLQDSSQEVVKLDHSWPTHATSAKGSNNMLGLG